MPWPLYVRDGTIQKGSVHQARCKAEARLLLTSASLPFLLGKLHDSSIVGPIRKAAAAGQNGFLHSLPARLLLIDWNMSS